MDQHIVLIPEPEDDNIVTSESCPNCHCRLFWIDELRSNHAGMSITVYVCMDCGYEEELAHD